MNRATAEAVFRRDRGCLMLGLHPEYRPFRGRVGPCTDRYGRVFDGRWYGGRDDRHRLTLDHVWEEGARLGDRAPSTVRTLGVLCWGHHVWGREGVSAAARDAFRAMVARRGGSGSI